MIKALCTYFWFFWHIKHIWKAIWRNGKGQFFIFRDAPENVVAHIAEMDEDGDAQFNRLVSEAKQEMVLRKRRKEIA